MLEIGSGHSTRFIAQAVADGGFACAITCIDPRAARRLSPSSPVTPAPSALFRGGCGRSTRELAAGDMLLIDSSHVAVPGSDVDLLLNTVLPRLAPGVLVHLHDIFLPDPYPADWAWRGYNEQVAVGCLLHGGGYAVRLASHYLATRHASAPGRRRRRPAAACRPGALGEQPLAGEAAAAPGLGAGTQSA